MTASNGSSQNLINRIVEAFLGGNLTVMVILVSLIAGFISLYVTPREEDPQIAVPVADVLISMPGASVQEVERQVATRLEKLLYQIEGVEYVYSTSYPSQALVTVRFYVGEDRERSWVKLHNKIRANIDQVPPGVSGWVVKPVQIEDVPIVNLTLYSDRYSDYELRRMAEELEIRLQSVKNAGKTYVIGGRPREITVHPLPQAMASCRISLSELQYALRGANVKLPAGSLIHENEVVRLEAGEFLLSAHEVKDLVVGVRGGRPVYLKEVAQVNDGPAEPENYSRIAFGPGSFSPGDPAFEGDGIPEGIKRFQDYPAVTVAVAKRRGTNAVWVSEEVQKEANRVAGKAFPEGVHLRVTRDYGKTADDKVDELVEALVVAIIIVVALLSYILGWREGVIIALAVPITFSLTLLVNFLLGYTINRVTLFALILSLGLVVDDPIVDVENIHRHFTMKQHEPYQAVLVAVNEVRPPIILTTLAVIVSFLPLFFITGMMGPYMAPMALNVPVTMVMSTVVAFVITPWLAYHLLKGTYEKETEEVFVLEKSPLYRLYAKVMMPLFRSKRLQWTLIGIVLLLIGFALWLVAAKRVPLKMLPFDNKNELQVVVDMPEGTSLESTEAATHALVGYLVRIPEVTDVTTYVGTSSPMDFNGMIRHYYLRSDPHQADIRFNLLAKKHRAQQSHAIGLRLRKHLKEISSRVGANIKIVEVPPGPPVIATLVAEVSGAVGEPYQNLIGAAQRVRSIMEDTDLVVDVDDVQVEPQPKAVFAVDRAKAALHGINSREVASLLQGSVLGVTPASLRLQDEVNPVHIRLRLPRKQRALEAQLQDLTVKGQTGEIVYLTEIGSFKEERISQPRYHKNLRPVVYVFGETAGLPPPEAILALDGKAKKDPYLEGFLVNWAGEGEWKITLRVFRDLGIAFGVAVFGIYIIILYQTQSYLLPIIQLIALPLSVIGILPGFWLLNVIGGQPVDGWPNPVYFTATAMIGMIALAGIATRNAILLIEFVEMRKKEEKSLVRSLIEAGALRTRPIFLTSITAMLAAWPITLDPVFSGLAWSLIFGLLVSTLFTLVMVPLVYFMVYVKEVGEEQQ